MYQTHSVAKPPAELVVDDLRSSDPTYDIKIIDLFIL